MKHMTKRLFALLLSLAMVVQLCPFTALADDPADDYVVKILTFEDGDYAGGESESYWSDLVDDPQYGGPLLYGDEGMGMDEPYTWWDKNNTGVYHALPSAGESAWGAQYCYWSYGEAISDYCSGDIDATGTYEQQLTVHKDGVADIERSGGGHNGSDHFAVHYGYADTSGYGLDESHLPEISFYNPSTKQYNTRVVEGMWVNLTNYLLQCIVDGNDLTANMGEDDVLYLKAIGYDANGKKLKEVKWNICEGQNLIVKDWTYWDLTELGAVSKIRLEINGSSDNGYGFSQPAYFAWDDLAVRVPADEIVTPDPEGCVHDLFYQEETPATCVEGGNIEFYMCMECGKYYADAVATVELTEEELFTEPDPSNHVGNITVTGATDPTCTEAGSTGSEVCDACNAIVTEAAPIPALGHSEVTATADNGDGTHKITVTCSVCEETLSETNDKHVDDNKDNTCDVCNAALEPEVHTHVDTDSNDFCDTCGVYTGTKATSVLPAKLIIPEGSVATFYVGENGEGFPIAAEDKGTDASNALIHRYELTIPDGKYSCVVTDETHNYGGVGFEYPLQTSIYEESNLTMVLAKYYTTTSSVKIDGVATDVIIDSPDDFTVNLVAPGKATIIPGENYLDTTITSGKTYVVAPRMVWAYGNQILYNSTVELNSDLAQTFGVSPQINQTFASTLTAIQKKTFSVSALKAFTLTAPTAADTAFYYQINNFNDMVLEGDGRVSSVDNGDGTTTYTVKYPAFANASYRCSQEGYVTAAGYAKDNTAYTVELRAGDPASTVTDIASKAGAGSNIEYENSVYLNIDDTKDTNELALQVGDTFRLRAFRAAWEIVNTVTANIMIEPDFHYSVLSGKDVVSVTPVTTQCTGNAKGNWMDLKALKEGTAVIAVWYDAIDVAGNTTLNGTYGATDPARYGYVVVNVGKDETVTWNPVSSDGDWDAEFDTVYYFGDAGTFTMKPSGAQHVTVQNLNAANAGPVQTVTANADGSYDVPVLTGSNLIAVTTATGTDYSLVRAKKISYTIENVTTKKTSADPDFVITKGDNVIVHFDQFNMPVAKMSGIYNPGYTGTAKTMYTLNGKYSLSSVGTQYDYITDAKSCITFDALVVGENTLSGGFIQSGSMGDNFGNHRNITDAGRGTNFSAVNVTGYFGSIEDITFNVVDNENVSVDYDNLVSIKKGSIFVGESTYNNAGTFSSLTSKTTVINAVNWTKTTADMEKQSQNFALKANVLPNGYYVDLQLRYWYDGEEVHTTNMIAGSDTIIPWSEFPHDANKILNVEVVVTPADPSIGPAKVYSFVWYPGNANLQYVHPILKALTATSEGETLSLDTDLLYTKTAYALDVADKTVINLSGSQLQKYTNKTNKTQDNSDTVIVTRMKDGQALDNGTTVLPETADKYPVGSWTLNDLDVSEADALQIQVISYVDSKYTRTYDIELVKAEQEHVHTPELLEVVPATCTETGLTEGSKCSVCNEILTEQEEVSALGHDFGEWTVETEPAVGVEGKKVRHCSRCEATEEDVIPALDPEPQELAIVTQPESYVGKIGTTATFTVEATGDELIYQWYYTKSGKNWYVSTSEGAQTAAVSVKLTDARDGQMYKCVITDAYNNTVTTDVVTLSKQAPATVITAQPVDCAAEVGDTATFTVVAEGTDLSYQWYYSKDGVKWSKSALTGCTEATITVPVTKSRLTQTYKCVITDADGTKLESNVVGIASVKHAKVTVTAQAYDAFLSAPADLDVASNEAEKYGYADAVDGVSVLDVLVAEHEEIFGAEYTKATAGDYLAMSNAGWINKIFAEETSNCGFTVNDLCPVEGDLIESEYGDYYNGLTVTTAEVVNDDTVNFFIYQDDYALDNYTFFKDAKGYTRSFEANKGQAMNLSVMGYCVAYYGMNHNKLQDVLAECEGLEGLQLAVVDPATGELTDIDDAITDEDGNVSVTFAEAGTYVITAYMPAESIEEDYETPAIMTLATVTVVDLDVLAITSQPESVTAEVNTVCELSVTATGKDLSYQWYYSKDGGKKWYKSTATGSDQSVMSIKLTNSRDGQMYRCRITDGDGNTVVSDAATLTIQ